MPTKFQPNALTFDQGIDRIQKALKKSGYDYAAGITTSADPKAQAALQELLVSNIPGGFKKFQLPLFFSKPTQVFLSIGAPDTEVPEHSHTEGAGLRFIVAGSVFFEGKELRAGDWMFIPAGKSYSLKVGPQGATLFYCYECCCA